MVRSGKLIPVLSGLLALLAGCSAAAPVVTPLPTAAPPPPTATLAAPAAEEPASDPPPALTLRTAPVVPEVPARMREVYAQGVAGGRNPGVFTRVGDCMSASPDYLFPYAAGRYDLGGYGELQPVIDHFNAEIVREVDGQPVTSFANPSLAVSCGFNSAGPIDPIWADPDFCQPGESSLTCELRVSRAAFVLIMLGTHDMHFPQERFKGYLTQMVEETIAAGAVPILITFPPRSDALEKTEAYNGVVVEVAAEQGAPLANLWLALHDQPNYGVQPDHPTALSLPADGCATCFSEENLRAGATLQNWVALMALQAVWTGVTP